MACLMPLRAERGDGFRLGWRLNGVLGPDPLGSGFFLRTQALVLEDF